MITLEDRHGLADIRPTEWVRSGAIQEMPDLRYQRCSGRGGRPEKYDPEEKRARERCQRCEDDWLLALARLVRCIHGRVCYVVAARGRWYGV